MKVLEKYLEKNVLAKFLANVLVNVLRVNWRVKYGVLVKKKSLAKYLEKDGVPLLNTEERTRGPSAS